MSQSFPVSGNIEPLTFPYLLVDLHRHGATGSLKVTGAAYPKALYFRSGRILFGSSNDSRDQLGAILIDSGRLTREQLDDVNAKVGPGNPLAKVLSESGFVSQRELNEAARHKVERILADVLSWDQGTFEFEDGVLPKGSVDLKLSTERLLLAAVQRIPDRAGALRHVELGLAKAFSYVCRIHLIAAPVAELRRAVCGLAERSIESGCILHGVGHDRNRREPRVVEAAANRADHAIHHSRGRDHVGTGLDLGDGCSRQNA